MFGLSATLAPKLNGIQVGFPYISKFIMDSNMKRLATGPAKTEPAGVPTVKPEPTGKESAKSEKSDEAEALLN
jgi:hypothetical protein